MTDLNALIESVSRPIVGQDYLINTAAWSWVDSDEFAAFWQVFIIYFGLLQSALCYKSLEWFKAYLDSQIVLIETV